MTTPELPPVPAPSYVPPAPPYGAPVQMAPGQVQPVAPYAPPRDPRYGQLLQAPPHPKRSAALGVVALILSLVATVGMTAVFAIGVFQVASGVGPRLATLPATPNWGILTPVREWVLVGEIGLYAGTAIGIVALILGIVATAQRRGRGAGIGAIVVSVLGPIAIAVVAFLAFVLAVGTASMGAAA